MAQRTVTAFKATKNTRFADSTTGEISEADSRDMFEDTADSFLNISDHFIDEDSFASNSATKVPSQQSVKAYVDAQVAAGSLSGTYTPTITNGSNVASSNAPNPCYYSRVGDVVTVSGWIEVDVTSTGVATALEITLPIASNFAATHQVTGFGLTAVRENISIVANQSTDKAAFGFQTATAGNQSILFTLQYLVI